jgi:hypothetical protein
MSISSNCISPLAGEVGSEVQVFEENPVGLFVFVVEFDVDILS